MTSTVKLVICVALIQTHTAASRCFPKSFNLLTVKSNLNFRNTEVRGCFSNDTIDPEVRRIECQEEKIQSLRFAAVKDLPELHSIEFYKNSLRHVEQQAFYNLPKLEQVRITHNELEFLVYGAFSHLQLEEIALSSNRISIIQEGAFKNLKSLRKLHLDRNKLKTFSPEWLLYTVGLYSIDLSHNEITSLPDGAFDKFYLLESVSLEHNRLCHFQGNLFGSRRTMTKLYLNSNSLRTIDGDAFEGYFSKNPNVSTVLVLSENQLMFLKEGILKSLESIQHVYLANNPWFCGCYKNITEWSLKNKKPLYQFEPEYIACIGSSKGSDVCPDEPDVEDMKLFFQASPRLKPCLDCCS